MNATAGGDLAWNLLEAGVKGRNKKYSQDSRIARSVAGGGALLAVADGHGSRAHHRSDLGSQWAVEAFTACARVLLDELARQGGQQDEQWPRLLAAARALPQQIVHHWRTRVALHEYNSPAGGSCSRVMSDGPDTIPYGSTLIGAIVVRRLLLCWQLGDGDIVLVEESGEPVVPLYDGPELGDEADSLCESEAWRQMRFYWQRLPAGRPTGVLLSTDGLSKSFTDHEGFVSFASGLRDRARDQGLGAVQEQLADWLGQAAKYSGDDSTLVGAFPAARYPAAEHPLGSPGAQGLLGSLGSLGSLGTSQEREGTEGNPT